jgi:hypothetical protein
MKNGIYKKIKGIFNYILIGYNNFFSNILGRGTIFILKNLGSKI